MKTPILIFTAIFLPVLGFFTPDSGSGIIRPCKIIHSGLNGKMMLLSENPALIMELDPETAKPLKQLELPGKPSGAVFTRSGEKLFVTAGGAVGRILEIDPVKFSITKNFSSGGHTPVSPVLSPDERSLYVCNRFNNEITQIDLTKRKPVRKYELVREPVSLVISGDGRYLFAGNFLPGGRSDASRVNSVVSVIDLEKGTSENIDLPGGSNSLGDMALSPDGKYIYVSHILGRFQVPTTQIERGWINTNALSIIDVEKKILSGTVLLDDINLGFSNPRAIGFSADGASLLVTSFGGSELSVIPRKELHAFLEGSKPQTAGGYGSSYTDPANDLSVMYKISRQRIKLPGIGPGSVAVKTNLAYITEYYTGTVCIVDLSNLHSVSVQQVTFGKDDPFNDVIRYGEMLFNSADLCFQKWQSCASCHPDARVDGLNWDLLNDGMGNPKNTKTMLHAHITPPAMSLGVRSTAEMAVRAGIRYIQFAEADEEKALAIDMYLKSLRPEISPYLVKNKLSKSAVRGKNIFEREGCASCHPFPSYTDLKEYDVKSGKGLDKDKAFDTPAITEVWRTAPYMHDGSILTMEELVRAHNPYGARTLTEDERRDLVEFVLSL
jgi:DNA-binding beta-propeller fold protein YncE/cytochrome c551/c552